MITATEIFCLNELGKRTNNEDSISPEKGVATLEDNLFIVCDGVGGEKKGEVASEIVCASIRNYLLQEPSKGEERESIEQAIQVANKKLADYIKTDTDAKRMSTTLALVLLGENSVIAAWCGDTRIHHIRNGKVLWKSKDHSLVSELISQGELTEQEARHHPRRNVITRSLNALNTNNAVDFHEITDFETGDYLLLCTDGLLEKIDEDLIYKILQEEKEKDKGKLFLSYCEGVTKDNFSMYLIQGKRALKKANTLVPSKPVASRKILLLIVALVICIVLILAFVLK